MPWIDQLRQDVRYALRGMRHSPAFVATTVVTLAVGLGLLTVAFTIVNAYVLRPFAIRDPRGLHQIVWRAPNDGGQGFRWRDYEELSRRTDLFSAIIGEHTRFVSSNGRPLPAAFVSLNYFEALGPGLQIGRGLGTIDADGSGNPVVLSDQAWAALFHRDPAILGRDLDLNGRPCMIVGVLGPAFTGLGDVPRDVFVPAMTSVESHAAAGLRRDVVRETEILVRLQPGVSAAAAETALTPLMKRIIETDADVRAEVRPQPSANPLSVQMIGVLSPIVAAFVLVLVAACANVSNVMLARAIARHREIAVRLSIGASRARVVRQLLTEGLLLALLAGAAGLGLAAAGLRLATLLIVTTLPPSVVSILRFTPMSFDARVFLFALVVSAAATALFALLPAVQASRVPLTDALRGQGGSSRRGSRLRNALVVAQVAVALVLVIVAATLARNGFAVGALDVRFETAGVMSVNVRGVQGDLARPLADRLASDPRVALLAVTSGNPLFTQGRILAAAPAAGPAATPTPCTFVSPAFFPLLRLPIARGRGFRDDEARTAAHVAIVSEATASAFWPGQDPIGKVIRIERAAGRPVEELPQYPEVTVIGTVRDIVSGMMVAGRDRGHIYLPITASDEHATAILLHGRTNRDLNPQVLQTIFAQAAPDPQIFEAIPLDEIRALQVYPLRVASWVGVLLGSVALLLSISGIYGVLTYALSQRRKEIGIRMALGATARAIVGLVLQQSTRLAGIGAAIGLAVAFVAMKALAAVIHLAAITLVDVASFAAGLAVIVAATLLAACQPARRAARVDPSEMLRADT